MCNSPKFQKGEVRTGAGGGYNEREGVEYKDRQESDDEYDEVNNFLRLFYLYSFDLIEKEGHIFVSAI